MPHRAHSVCPPEDGPDMSRRKRLLQDVARLIADAFLGRTTLGRTRLPLLDLSKKSLTAAPAEAIIFMAYQTV